MQTLQQLIEARDTLGDEAEAIVALAEQEQRELSAEESTRVNAILGEDGKPGEIAALDGKIEQRKKLDAVIKQRAQARLGGNVPSADQVATGLVGTDGAALSGGRLDIASIQVPVSARSTKPITAFQGEHAEREAYVAGRFFLGTMFGHSESLKWCADHGIVDSMVTTDGGKGGHLVPDELATTLIRLREARSVFAQYARSMPMGSDTISVNRVIGDVTAEWAGEGSTGTPSDAKLGQAELVSKKLMALSKFSSELDEDAVVEIGNLLIESMAYAMADKMDQAGFNGDGKSTYGGITGLKSALDTAAIKTAATGNNAAGSLDLTDFEGVCGLLPEYTGASPRWFMHKTFYWNSARRLMNAAGGNTISELAAGHEPMFLGYPVTFAQVMPAAPAASAIGAYFGDLSLGATVGRRRGVRVATSDERYFEEDMLAVKTTERCAINVHERGDTDKTRPMVALKLAS